MFLDLNSMNRLGVASSLECNISMIVSHKFIVGIALQCCLIQLSVFYKPLKSAQTYAI